MLIQFAEGLSALITIFMVYIYMYTKYFCIMILFVRDILIT